MKKIYFFLGFIFAVNVISGQVLTENFNYTAGQLITANGWTAHSGASTNAITVTAPGLTYSSHAGSGIGNAVSMTTSGEDDNSAFTAITTGSVYMSFLVNLSNAQTGDYFIGLYQTSSIFPLRIYAKSDGAGGFNFGVSKGSSTPVVYESTARSFGTTYFIVANYIFNTGTTTDDVINLWVNPALGGVETTATIPNVTGSGTDGSTIGAVFLRQGGASSASTQQVDAVLIGTTWADVTPATGATPSLSATTLTDFGNICTGTTAGPNSFTISGTNLTTANITVAALPGFTYSTTSGGTYTTTLSLTQPGGTFSQDIFVKFNPTAVQSYNGNISIAGGGVTTPITVAAAGSGVASSVPGLTTGAATAITANSATAAGTITGTGCSSITTYGIEYSTTSGFPNGTGTAVTSSNLTGGDFSSNLTGLTAGVVYYYHSYATNTTGTGYGSEQSFTTTSAGFSLIENFVYPSGQLLTANGWAAHSGAGTNAQTVTSPGLSYSGHPGSGVGNAVTMTTSGEDVNKTAGTANSGSVYVSFLVNVSAAQTGDYFVGLLQTTTTFPVRIFAKSDGTGGFNFGLSKNSTTVVYETTSRNFGTTYLIVAKYMFNSATTTDDEVFLWVNPALGGTETTATIPNVTSTATDATAIIGVYLRQGSAASSSSQQIDAILAGTTWAEVTPAAAPSPILSSSALTSFGNVCINTTTAPNSFTISGTNLTTANVTVAALAGYTYSTTSGGTYTTSLSLIQPGGTYSQQIFVKFNPTAVQSYNGNISVGGGGATAINATAAGAGVNDIPALTTGVATSVTQTTATAAGTITSIGCSAVTAYGIEYSTTNGFTPGTGTQVTSSNFSSGNFSANLSGLIAATTYYYRAYATNTGGTGYGAQMSFTTVSLNPTITTTTLTAFGNVCINSTAGPNTFTINGTNLTTANVTVGPLGGYTFSTTSGGTYTASLSLTQPGGTYSQQIFVRFTPTALQSYSGNIPVSGGGVTAAVNVLTIGNGINSSATVTTGVASAITTTTATLAGSISSIGCSAVSAYGVEYSTTNGFANGTGIQVTSTNLSAGNFTSAVSGLLPSTTYYYKAFATNSGGTAYGAQQSFITATPPPPVLTATTLASFGSVCLNNTTAPNSFTINGTNLTTAALSVGPLTGFTFSETSGGTYVNTLAITQAGGTQSKTVFVKFTPLAVQSYAGNIPVTGGGATAINVAADGNGVNTLATVATGASSDLTNHSAKLAGAVSVNGCSNVTAYGIEFSGINGFPNGSGTKVPSTNIAGGIFTSSLTGLVQGATYYYKAYATNSGGTAYGPQQTLIVPSIAAGFTLYPVPIDRGTDIRITKSNITPGYYGLLFFNSNGQLVYQFDMNIQANFINQIFTVPATLSKGIYRVQLVDHLKIIETKNILVM